MEGTKQTISNVLGEIEGVRAFDAPETGGEKTTDEIMDILLGKKGGPLPGGSRAQFAPMAGSDMEELRRWRDRNNEICEVNYSHPMFSSKPVIGRGIVLAKKLVRKLIKPILLPILAEQNEFNSSVTESVNALYKTTRQSFYQESMLESMNREIGALRKEIARLKPAGDEASAAETQAEPEEHSAADAYTEIDYAKFEDHFRGSREEIKERQKMYLPYLEGKKNVIDLGCGRGEFLELLKENRIYATGVDSYAEFVTDCNSRGLHVIEGDGIKYIHDLDEASVDGIFALQLAEHLQTSDLVRLCTDSYKKLTQGGILVIETPNPGCLSIYTNAFYLDPSHTKPVHPKMLEYFLRDAGFEKIEIVYTEASRLPYRLPLLNAESVVNLGEFNDGLNLLSDLIFGSQDYAIIAHK